MVDDIRAIARSAAFDTSAFTSYTVHRVRDECWQPDWSTIQPPVTVGIAPVPRRRAALHVCTLQKDEWPLLQEWVAFHRAMGVDRITIWDDASSPEIMDAMLRHWRPLLERGELELRSIRNMTGYAAMLRELSGYVHSTHFSKRADSSTVWCGPSPAELQHLEACADVCSQTGHVSVFVACQMCAIHMCAGWSKLIGDAFLGIWDADEFVFSVRDECYDRACVVTKESSPLLTGRGFRTLPQALSVLAPPSSLFPATITIHGVMLGTNGYADRAAWQVPSQANPQWSFNLMTAIHTRGAAYDAYGRVVPHPQGCDGVELSNLCGSADPAKSIVRVSGQLPITRMNIHKHAVGVEKEQWPRRGQLLRYHHYAYPSADEGWSKKVLRNQLQNTTASAQVFFNRNDAVAYFNAARHPELLGFEPLLRFCMTLEHLLHPACAVSGAAAHAVAT